MTSRFISRYKFLKSIIGILILVGIILLVIKLEIFSNAHDEEDVSIYKESIINTGDLISKDKINEELVGENFNWITYTDKELGFQFQHPDYLEVVRNEYVGIVEEEFKRAYIASFRLELIPSQSMPLSIHPLFEISFSIWTSGFHNVSNREMSSMTLEALKIYKFTDDYDGNGDDDIVELIIPTNTRDIVFKLETRELELAEASKEARERYVELAEVFLNIAETFKQLDK